MRYRPLVALTLGVLTYLQLDTIHACSTFCIDLDGRRFFGRNYDFDIGDGLVMTNPSGLRKSGVHSGGPRWTSRFGSVTFNQFGRDSPMGGMNEAGLVVELMWLDEARYPKTDARAPLGVLEWIQYQLDTAATVDDVIKSDVAVRIQGQVPLHYLVSDTKGKGATIEFLDGALVVHSGDSLPVSVLTNSTYASSLAFAKAREQQTVSGAGSLERFARAARALETVKRERRGPATDALFGVLAAVAQPNTRWSIVYDQTAGTVSYRTAKQPSIRRVSLKAVTLTCDAGARMLDIDAPGTGDVTSALAPYASEPHLAFVRKAYAGSSVTRDTPADQVTAAARHAEAAKCMPRS